MVKRSIHLLAIAGLFTSMASCSSTSDSDRSQEELKSELIEVLSPKKTTSNSEVIPVDSVSTDSASVIP